MNKKHILKHIDKNGFGLEIGPCHNPVAPKKEGYKIQIIDHMSRSDLLKKYKDHKINTANIEDVDFVWEGQSYAELTGKEKHYDWIIASHVIEHTPDLINFLKQCDSILKDDGVISLVVPDKRYCFDHFRPITGIASIIDHHLQHKTVHSPGKVAEYFLNAVSKSGSVAWNASDNGQYKMRNTVTDAFNLMHRVINDNKYIDIHAWCFVPHSFRLLIDDLYQLKFSPFKEVDFQTTEGCEFFITLGRNGKELDIPRLEILEIIDAEINEHISPPHTLKDKCKNIVKHIIRRNRY